MPINKSERLLDTWYAFRYRVLDTYPGFIFSGVLAAVLTSWLLIDDISVEAVVAAAVGGGAAGTFGKWVKRKMDNSKYERDLREYETGGDRGGV